MPFTPFEVEYTPLPENIARMAVWVRQQLDHSVSVYVWWHPTIVNGRPRLSFETATPPKCLGGRNLFERPRDGGWRRAIEFHPSDTAEWRHVVRQYGMPVEREEDGIWCDEEPQQWPLITSDEIKQRLLDVWHNPPEEP